MRRHRLLLNWLTLALAVGVICSLAGVVTACPNCKEALASDGGNVVAGYFWSILFMMSMPFVILGTFGGSMYLSVRRARAAQQCEQEPIERR